MTTRLLDWRDRRHWNGGRKQPCIHCDKPAFLLDHHHQPAHKVCTVTTPENRPNRR